MPKKKAGAAQRDALLLADTGLDTISANHSAALGRTA